MPWLAQALKKLPVVMLPPVRRLWRTAQYWLNVAVPMIEGALTRCVS